MAVFDANATADVTANGVTSITSSNLTVGTGAQRALVVQLSFSNKSISGLSVTWDNGASNQACSQVVGTNTSGANGRAEIWGRVNPINGAKTLAASWTGSSDVVMNQVSWTGVNQGGGTSSFVSASNTGTSTTGSVAIPSRTNNQTMCCITIANGIGSLSAPTQTQTHLDNNPANISGGGSRAVGAASVTHSWTLSVSETWVVVGVDIQDAAAPSNKIVRPFPFKPSQPPAVFGGRF